MAQKIPIEPAIKIKQFASLDEIERSVGKLPRQSIDEVKYDLLEELKASGLKVS